MQTVPFGKTGKIVSRLGFGMMRLPTVKKDDGSQPIDREEAIRMLRYGIDHGINYVDTAYGYHNGESEIVTGLGLKDGYRERVMLASKLPQWLVNKEEDMDRLLDEQLSKLDVSHLDFYLLHALNGAAFTKLQKLNYKKFLEKAKADGRIRFAGFSFHDEKAEFLRMIDDYDWDMAQIQFNYLDDQYQATVDGLRYAGDKGIPIVVMEPLRGGALANPPRNVKSLMDAHPSGRSAVNWAFRYVGDFPQVATILSGMTTMEQLKENLSVFEQVLPNSLTREEHDFIAQLKKSYLARVKIGCTGCDYCQPCPQGVLIPRIFAMYNESYMLNQPGSLHFRYSGVIKDGGDGSLCVECGQCEAACPQQLPIIETLKVIHGEAAK
ncbi:MAG: aldo/keto reductase [Christensenellales bacterium]|jgi:predicted aldo/keto reductase-like oxidoreductase